MALGGALLTRAAYVASQGLLLSQAAATGPLEKSPTQAEP